MPLEIAELLDDGRAVILHPYLNADGDVDMERHLEYDVLRDLIDVHGVSKAPAAVGEEPVPKGAFLLCQPLGMLTLERSSQDYLAALGSKRRNRVKKAEKEGYAFHEFTWNDWLADIDDINRSKAQRQGGAMHGWYAHAAEPRNYTARETEYLKYYGLFRDGHLRAYCHLVQCGDFCFFKHFIGHGDDLVNGVMNALMAGVVTQYSEHSRLRWFMYGTLHKADTPLEAFAKHVGCEPYAVVMDMTGHDDLLRYAHSR
jgi:hypothetical protein